MVDFNLAIGIFGALVQLVAFALNLTGKLRYDSTAYVGANAFGTVLTSYYAYASNTLPFLMLEATWGAVSFWKLAGILGKKGRGK
ncbi:Uncharacterised protein [uncultured archaeon]|nr:Uncharacterised protein [uncultured archaeon]